MKLIKFPTRDKVTQSPAENKKPDHKFIMETIKLFENSRSLTGDEQHLLKALKMCQIRLNAMYQATFSHVDGRDLLKELHPRKSLDIIRRIDGKETRYEADWLSNLMNARDKELPEKTNSAEG